ncbi:MAG: hypothetical protein F4X40_00800 [Chloroflexi bacterium]|nr:hypothetical protein [Chloroflexota bacterium]
MLFDFENHAVRIESPYTGEALRITPKTAGDIAVRVPSWADVEAIVVDGEAAGRFIVDGRISLRNVPVGRAVELQLPLAERDLTIHHQDHEIGARLRGDAVVAMDDLGAGLAYFPPLS